MCGCSCHDVQFGVDARYKCMFCDNPAGPIEFLYKIVVRGDTASNAFGNFFSDDLYFKINRVSPIVVYANLSDSDAIELAQRDDFEVTRARSDWSI